jgi:hypothetical protein
MRDSSVHYEVHQLEQESCANCRDYYTSEVGSDRRMTSKMFRDIIPPNLKNFRFKIDLDVNLPSSSQYFR